jgi:HPt (histidine-containing phosphotransfer) domain-containing protein
LKERIFVMVATVDIDGILASTQIDGLDIQDGLKRFSNKSSMYMRIVGTFIKSMPNMLAELSEVTEATIADYAIKVHGAKGSCYGIGATKCGDAAFELEKAAKAADWDAVQAGNAPFIELTTKLVDDLKALEAQAHGESAANENGKPEKDVPDSETIKKLLHATEEFNIEQMQTLIDDLDKYLYAQEKDLGKWHKAKVDEFDYESILNKLRSLGA